MYNVEKHWHLWGRLVEFWFAIHTGIECRKAYGSVDKLTLPCGESPVQCTIWSIWKRGLQVPRTLLPHTQSEVERRLGSRSASGCAMELGLFLLPWHCCLAPSSICSFGTYSCDDYEQSLIKLQRILPRNVCVSVYGDVHLDCSCIFLFLRMSVRAWLACIF